MMSLMRQRTGHAAFPSGGTDILVCHGSLYPSSRSGGRVRPPVTDKNVGPPSWGDLSIRFVAALVAISLSSHPIFALEHADVIDLTKQHQVIENFGASDCWTFQRLGGWSEASRNKV